MSQLTPNEIVETLDQYIIGQGSAKKAVAIALRNRWRRMQLDPNWRQEITPKNILMIGPTGVGKTEIARRLASLAKAPFIKVEATKFTEVGYVGKEVDSIIRDLVEIAIKLVRQQQKERVQADAQARVEERILEALLPQKKEYGERTAEVQQRTDSPAKALLRERLRAGSLEEEEIELLCQPLQVGMEIVAPSGMEEMTNQLQNMFQHLANQKKKMQRMPIQQARQQLLEEETQRLIPTNTIKREAIELVEQQGIVFLDEIDKLCHQATEQPQSSISREGVQRDLLPLLEGCTVSTKHGTVRTDHILFIASGAFQLTTPAQLIPELQGRLPIRVELDALDTEAFEKILTEPHAALTKQYITLLQTENIELSFRPCGIKKLAEAAFQVNQTTENIGARRLHTILEKVLEEISFTARAVAGTSYVIDAAYVAERLDPLVQDQDLSRFVL